MNPSESWTEFEEVVLEGPAGQLARELPYETRTWVNSRYMVTASEFPSGVTWLSIKRKRKEHVHDWRELLRVKNELTSPDREALEIYPGSWRVVDTSNQYHLFVLPLGVGLNLGFVEGHVEDIAPDRFEVNRPRQRPLPAWMARYREGDCSPTAKMAMGGDDESGLALTFAIPLIDETEEEGDPPMEPAPHRGDISLRTSPDLHREVALAAAVAGVSMNRWLVRTLREAVGKR